ncbi:transglutaminase TgpA family protein [Pseudonocardia asaccharolytica]|uniref:Transglutaminase-like domain-containing protein n=1 Tax=Pseudonocardia asaccharolytica DSM 44247 = NBRC 16224 TaxID=1123024 RepID=A0A511CXA9_9PSEU|nr:transglutaminaseTgpA domain-containing protein [Pseudonocardia asaccharolytica]GEL17196.1 hypothetical protein PA7_10330 [Pseudonocardia asaccharolytica DSM 44247 = NBRC 16224]
MTAPVLDRLPAPRRATRERPRRRVGWVAPPAAGAAVLLSGAPVASIAQGPGWFGYAVGVVGLVVAVGLALRRTHPVVVALAQLAAVLELLVALFSDQILPGPAAAEELGNLLAGAAGQIDTGLPPVAATPEILLLVTGAFGLVTVVGYAISVSAAAPAIAGIPLLVVFAVPTALAGSALPWWAITAPAAGFGLLLLTREGARRQLPAGVAVTAAAIVVALLLGSAATMVGTGGRFAGGSGTGGSGGSIGLNPFTSLRGQLIRDSPTELFRVSGLPRPQYLRAITLRDFVPQAGFQVGAPAPGVPLDGPLPAGAGQGGERAVIDVENVGFRDYWFPLYGHPQEVTGLSDDDWRFDPASGTAYNRHAREEDDWQQQAVLPAPTATQLRAATGPLDVDRAYLSTEGVDPRAAALAVDATRGARTDFDKAVALVGFFTAPDSGFSYSLQTTPGAGDNALVEFLTVGRTGYCEQFSSAMAIMLRTVGVPARVAVGFTAGTAATGYRSVTTADAHAWVEAYFPGHGWTTFDPTPLTDGRALVPPYVQEVRDQERETGSQNQDDDLTPGELAGADGGPTPEPPTAPPVEIGGPTPAGPGFSLVLPVAVLVVAMLGLAPAGLRVLLRRRRLAAVAAGGPGAAVAGWEELLAESTDRGVLVRSSDTVRAAARRLIREHRLDDNAQQALRTVVRAVEASWYGQQRPDETPEVAGELGAVVRTVAAGIAAGSRLSLRERLLPRSVLRRDTTPAAAEGHPDGG